MAFTLKLRKTPSDEGVVQPVIASNGVPFLQMRSVGSHSTSGREKEGIKDRTGGSKSKNSLKQIQVLLFLYLLFRLWILDTISALNCP